MKVLIAPCLALLGKSNGWNYLFCERTKLYTTRSMMNNILSGACLLARTHSFLHIASGSQVSFAFCQQVLVCLRIRECDLRYYDWVWIRCGECEIFLTAKESSLREIHAQISGRYYVHGKGHCEDVSGRISLNQNVRKALELVSSPIGSTLNFMNQWLTHLGWVH